MWLLPTSVCSVMCTVLSDDCVAALPPAMCADLLPPCCVPVVFDSGRCYLPHGVQFGTTPSRGGGRAELISHSSTVQTFGTSSYTLWPVFVSLPPSASCVCFNLWAVWLTGTHPLNIPLITPPVPPPSPSTVKVKHPQRDSGFITRIPNYW